MSDSEKECCPTCRIWHRPGEHVRVVEVPEVLTGQVPVSGNHDPRPNPDPRDHDGCGDPGCWLCWDE